MDRMHYPFQILERRLGERHQRIGPPAPTVVRVMVGQDQSDFSCIALWTLGLLYLRKKSKRRGGLMQPTLDSQSQDTKDRHEHFMALARLNVDSFTSPGSGSGRAGG